MKWLFWGEFPSRCSEKVNFHFANYRFSFHKLQISISQTTDSHFANYRFPFRFVPFRFANYSKPNIKYLSCTFTLSTFSKSYSGQVAWGCYILSQLFINSPCMLILIGFDNDSFITGDHIFMIMWKMVMVWFVATRPGKVKIVEEPAVYRSGMWVLLQ